MNISWLNSSISISFDLDIDSAIDALAEKAGNTVASSVKFFLKRSVEDTQKVLKEVSKGVNFIAEKISRDFQDTCQSATRLHSNNVNSLTTQYRESKILALQLA